MSNLLVTGLSGLIGSAAKPVLVRERTVTGLNRSDVDGIRVHRADLGDYDAMRPAFDGQDTVLHLAAKINDAAGWDALHETNVVGTRNVFEAAADAGVKRVVFASSGATVAGWEREAPYAQIIAGAYDDVPADFALIDESMPARPANLYAATKVWGEALARHYADNRGLEIICLRIGWVDAGDRPRDPRGYSVFLSQRDVVQGIQKSLDRTMTSNLETYFLLSDNRWGYRSIDAARTDLGYAPLDSADAYR